MATIKSFTDISQSKKLAEILPLESADMYYEEVCNLPKVIVGNYILHNQCMEDKDYKKLSNPVLLPAWSIASLLDVLPDNYVDINDTIYHPNLMKTKDGRYMVIYNVSLCTSLYNNPVDACVAMIEKLHELNLL